MTYTTESTYFELSDDAWDHLWSVEEADRQCVGCLEHQDPSCLCDVDLSRTKDITWDKCPPELLGVQTTEELVRAAGAMLLRHDLHARLAPRQLRKQKEKSGNYQLDLIGGRIEQASRWECFEELVSWLIHNPSATATEAAKRFGVDLRPVESLRQALGRPPAHKLAPWKGQMLEWARQGLNPSQITKRLCELGVEAKYNSVYRALERWGAVERKRPYTAAPRPKLTPYKAQIEAWLEEGLSPREITERLNDLGVDVYHSTVYKALRRWGLLDKEQAA